ncbi:MAG: hypothetical protein RIS36_915 [Pseudomonadota bacterium]
MSTTPVTNEPSQGETPRAPSRSIFQDPAIAMATQNDPFARWVVKHWRTIVVVLLAIGAAIMGYDRFATVALEKRSAATAVLNSVQESYHQLVTNEETLLTLRAEEAAQSDAAEKAKITAKIASTSKEVDQLKDKVILMVESLDSSAPFGTLKELYRGLLAARLKEYDKTKNALASASWEEVGKPESSERFMAELIAFGLARALVDSDVHREFARGQLVRIAEQGTFVAVPAASTLLTIAVSDPEKAQAQRLVDALRTKYPSQQRFLANLGDSES